jgi:hypothetical protein
VKVIKVVVVALVAAFCIGIVAVGSEVWAHPVLDTAYRGFDAGLISAQYRTGKAEGLSISHDAVELRTIVQTRAVNLVTTTFSKFTSSFDVAVKGGGSAQDTTVVTGVWSPWTGAGYFLVFSGGSGIAETRLVANGTPGPILMAGNVIRRRTLGPFAQNQNYHVDFDVARSGGLRLSVAGPGLAGADSVTPRDLPALFSATRLSLGVAANSTGKPADVVFTNYHLQLPHETLWANKVDDPTERVLLLGSLGLSAGLLLLWLVLCRDRAVRLWANSRIGLGAIRFAGAKPLAIGAAVAVYLLGNALLFTLGGHPFDMGNEKVYAYVGGQYGPAQLYYLPNTVSLAWIWAGAPFSEAAFPYDPTFAYLFAGIGWIGHVVFGSAGAASASLEVLIKAVNVVFGLGDAVLIYLIAHPFLSKRWSTIGAALFLFNPAVWFSMSVWGQTHVISVFFVLLAIWASQRDWPLAAWLSLLVACLTRPQMLVFGVIIGVFLLRRFPLRRNVLAISWATIATFLALAPLTLATSPSLPVDVMANNFRIQEAGGNDPALTTVSQDAYSVWPLVTYFHHGASGYYRSFTPSAQALLGPLSYQRAGLIATASVLMGVIVGLLWRSRRDLMGGAYLPLVALGIVGFLMFMTGLVATHFLLALPFVILCRRWMSNAAFFFAVTVWTITMLVPMYGDMGNVITRLDYPLLSPVHNGVTRFFVELYSWDRFITFATLANIAVLIWIAVTALRPKSQPDLIEATT